MNSGNAKPRSFEVRRIGINANQFVEYRAHVSPHLYQQPAEYDVTLLTGRRARRYIPFHRIHMDGPTVAIIVSFLSFGVSLFALGWNIYRDVYLKSRLRLVFGLYTIHHDSLREPQWRYSLSATNLGPGKVKLTAIALREYSLWKRIRRTVKHAVVVHDFKHPFGGRIPCDLEVGEVMQFTFAPKDCKWLSEDGFTQIGICDSYGRTHWCTEKDMADAKKTFREKAWAKDPQSKGAAE